MMAVGAVQAWNDLKKAVPFFGGVEIFIDKIRNGKWAEAWAVVAKGAQDALGSIFGKDAITNFQLKIQLMKDTAISEFGLMKNALLKTGGPIDLMNQGLTKLGKGDLSGGFSSIWVGLDKSIGIATTRITDWVKLNFGVDLNQVGASALAIGNKILDGIKGGLTFIARTWIDPFIASLFKVETWTTAILALGGAVVAVGQAILNGIYGAITTSANDPAAQAKNLVKIGTAIWGAITNWMETNLPDAKKAMENFAQGIADAFNSTGIWFQNIGIGIWNNIIEGLKKAVPVDFGDAIKGWLESQKKKPIELPVSIDTNPAILKWDATKKMFVQKPVTATILANATSATNITNKFKNNAQKPITIPVHAKIVGPDPSGAMRKALSNIPKQHGFMGTVKRPTSFLVGEGGRPEDVYIKPRGSSGQ